MSSKLLLLGLGGTAATAGAVAVVVATGVLGPAPEPAGQPSGTGGESAAAPADPDPAPVPSAVPPAPAPVGVVANPGGETPEAPVAEQPGASVVAPSPEPSVEDSSETAIVRDDAAGPSDAAAVVQHATPSATAEPQTGSAVQQPAQALAALPDAAVPDPQTGDTAAPQGTPTPDVPAPTEVMLEAPSFELVRIEADGSALIAGSADAGADVSLLLDGTALERARAGRDGSFVMFAALPSLEAVQVLQLRSDRDGLSRLSDAEVIVAPARPRLAESVAALPQGTAPAPVPPSAGAGLASPDPALAARTPSSALSAEATVNAAPVQNAPSGAPRPDAPSVLAQPSPGSAQDTGARVPSLQAGGSPPRSVPAAPGQPSGAIDPVTGAAQLTTVRPGATPQGFEVRQGLDGTGDATSALPQVPTPLAEAGAAPAGAPRLPGVRADAGGLPSAALQDAGSVPQPSATVPPPVAQPNDAQALVALADPLSSTETRSVPVVPAPLGGTGARDGAPQSLPTPPIAPRAAPELTTVPQIATPGDVAASEPGLVVSASEARPGPVAAPSGLVAAGSSGASAALEEQASAPTPDTAVIASALGSDRGERAPELALPSPAFDGAVPRAGSLQALQTPDSGPGMPTIAPSGPAPQTAGLGVEQGLGQSARDRAAPGVDTVTEGAVPPRVSQPAGPVQTAAVAAPPPELFTAKPPISPPETPVGPATPQAAPQSVGMTGAAMQDLPVAQDGVSTPEPQSGPAAAPTVLLSSARGVEVLQAAPLGPSQVALDAISYDAEGEVFLSGRGTDAAYLRIYLDNTPVTTSRIQSDGRWSVGLPQVDSGTYTLRVDQLDASGRVTARVESPFLRESRENVLASGPEGLGPASAVVVQPGNTLWAIARERYGEGIKYVRVFRANRDQIRDPDLIYPGQIFALPDDAP